MEANTLRPKDLRIGNHINGIYIYEYDGENDEIIEGEKTTFCTIVSLDTTDSTTHPIMVESDANIESFERMEGIPLSEDWLFKLGFEKQKGLDRWFIAFQGRWHFLIKDGYKWRCIFEVNGKDLIINQTGFEFVHQLQNLYHSLTGEELTIKE